jgi:hypothetical protein
MSPISGIQDPGVLRSLEQSQSSPAAVDHLAGRFADLLAQDPATRPAPEVGAPNVISSLLGQHERMYQDLMRDMQKASLEAPSLNPQEATVKHTEMMFRVVNVSAQNNAFSYIAQSAKNGLQTLMKNQ